VEPLEGIFSSWTKLSRTAETLLGPVLMPCLWLDPLSWQAALSLQLLAACLMELLDAASATVISFLAFPCLVVVLSESPHLEPVLFSSSALEPLTLGSGLA
jgi:hypothetical protein